MIPCFWFVCFFGSETKQPVQDCKCLTVWGKSNKPFAKEPRRSCGCHTSLCIHVATWWHWRAALWDVVLSQPSVILTSHKHNWRQVFNTTANQMNIRLILLLYFINLNTLLFIYFKVEMYYFSPIYFERLSERINLECILFIKQLNKRTPDVAIRLEITSVLLHRRVLPTWYVHDMQNMSLVAAEHVFEDPTLCGNRAS